MEGPSQYELQILKNIQENKKILASLGLDKFKVSAAASHYVSFPRAQNAHCWWQWVRIRHERAILTSGEPGTVEQ